MLILLAPNCQHHLNTGFQNNEAVEILLKRKKAVHKIEAKTIAKIAVAKNRVPIKVLCNAYPYVTDKIFTHIHYSHTENL